MVFLKKKFEKVDFKKNQQTTKTNENFPRGRVKCLNKRALGAWAHHSYPDIISYGSVIPPNKQL